MHYRNARRVLIVPMNDSRAERDDPWVHVWSVLGITGEASCATSHPVATRRMRRARDIGARGEARPERALEAVSCTPWLLVDAAKTQRGARIPDEDPARGRFLRDPFEGHVLFGAELVSLDV